MARGTWVTGVVLLAVAVLIPTMFFVSAGFQGEAGNDWDAFGSFILGMVFLFVVSPIIGIVGLVLLIAGLASGGQQQQQQVVVYTGTRRCPRCSSDIEGSQRFCATCGAGVHG